MKYYPNNYDSKGIWAGLYDQKGPLMYLWYLGEILSCLGFLSLTLFMWMEENDKDSSNSTLLVAFYIVFLVSAMFWMPLAIQGDRFYTLTILFLLITSISAIVLLVESLLLWSAKAWLLLPLALHTTLFDLGYWCWTWKPTPYKLLSQSTKLNFCYVDQYTNTFQSTTHGRPLFIIEEEENGNNEP